VKSETEFPQMTIPKQAALEFHARTLKESICVLCIKPGHAEMAICTFCHEFRPTKEAIDVVLRHAVETVSA
jgi:hypothetical protein